jgi:hypothetical protein
VLFSIRPLPGLPSGTVIPNRATIQFEIFDPLVTPEVVNIIDSTPPSCVMSILPEQTTTLDIPLSWSGTDEVGEIDSYTIFVSVDGGAFTPFLERTQDTTGSFTGEDEKTYRFICVATDTAGNSEVQEPVAEAVTQITAAPGLVITATATGSPTPPTAPFPETVTNGDFLIRGYSNRSDVGDGRGETTTWVFDFTTDPDFSSVPASAPIESALLTITLEPKGELISTDSIRIQGLHRIMTPLIQGLPVGVTTTIQLELLDFYASSDILRVFTRNAGHIPMAYNDDAIISFAQLELIVQPATP